MEKKLNLRKATTDRFLKFSVGLEIIFWFLEKQLWVIELCNAPYKSPADSEKYICTLVTQRTSWLPLGPPQRATDDCLPDLEEGSKWQRVKLSGGSKISEWEPPKHRFLTPCQNSLACRVVHYLNYFLKKNHLFLLELREVISLTPGHTAWWNQDFEPRLEQLG